MFKHVPNLTFPELDCDNTPNGRFYVTPEGKRYPSVTTVLGKTTDQSWLKEWEDRVGKERVEHVSKQASRRGTAVHEIAEKYLRNDPDYKKGEMPVNIASFNYIKPFLDENVGLIAGLELPLYSDFLRTAGRVDMIAKWNGEWAIIDFKTSKRNKKKEDITNYFLQASCYSYMFFERTGLHIPKIVIVMTVDDSEPLIFEERSKDYITKFIKLRNTLDI